MKSISLTLSKDMANVKVFANRQTNRQTDKNYMPPVFQYRGMKMQMSKIKKR
jgi:hypothetical protein